MLRLMLSLGALVSVLTWVAPHFSNYTNFNFLGVPFAYILGFAPPLLPFLLVALAALEYKAIRWHIVMVSAFLLLLGLVSIPPLFNRQIDQRAVDLLAGDLLEFARPRNLRTLAVRGRSDVRCDELCQRVLLNGQVDRVLYAPVYDMSAPFDPSAPAQSFRMARRAECPYVELDITYGEFIVASDVSSGVRQKPADMMKQAMARGFCLIAENATMGEAEVVFSRGPISTVEVPKSRSIFRVSNEMVRATRLSIHKRDGDVFRETYRSTTVVGDRLSPLVFATLNFGQLDARTIFRYDPQTYHEGPRWNLFIIEMLGISVALPRNL